MTESHPPKHIANDPLHGVKLQDMLEQLEEYYGWDALAYMVPVRCFTHTPSVRSSLKFLRKTPWARQKVEHIYRQLLTES